MILKIKKSKSSGYGEFSKDTSSGEAYTRAMAVILKDAGITILKASDSSTGEKVFSKIDVNKTVDENGNITYSVSDFPPNS